MKNCKSNHFYFQGQKTFIESLLLFAGVVWSLNIHAATIHWDGDAGDGEWTTASNWVGDVLPGTMDDVIIDNGNTVILSSGTASIRSINLGNDSDLTIGAAATLNITPPNTYGVKGIDVEICSNCEVNNSGTLHIDGGYHGIMTNSNFNNLAGGNVLIENWGFRGVEVLNWANISNYGTITLNGTTGTAVHSPRCSNSGTININGGNQAWFASDAGSISNSGSINIAGSAGGIFVYDINGSTGSSITISGTSSDAIVIYSSFWSPGRLQTTGAMDFYNVPLQAGTTAPGHPIGTMTFQQDQTFENGHTLEVEVNGTTPGTEHDQLVVNGTATLAGNLNASINYTPTNGDRIVVVSATTISGTFSGVVPALPNDWHIDYSVPGEVALVYDYVVGVWDGDGGDGEWTTATNWEGDILPTTLDNVIINNGDAVTFSAGTASVNTVTLSNDSDLTVGAAATLNITPPNTYGVKGIDVEICSNCEVNNSGTLHIDGGYHGIMTNSNFNNLAGGNVLIENWGFRGVEVLNWANISNYGTITLNGTTGTAVHSPRCSNSGTININGGNQAWFASDAGSISNSGSINIAGSAGGIFVYDINGSTGSSITISGTSSDAIVIYSSFWSPGRLQTTGAMDFYNVPLQAGTTAPGHPIGTMTFQQDQTFENGHTLEVEVNGTTPGTEHDQLVVNGTATIGGTLNASINYTPTGFDRVVILSATTISGTFSVFPALPPYWSVDYSVPGEVALIYSYDAGLWDGDAGDKLWMTAANWDGDVLPKSTDNVRINNGDVVTLSNTTTMVKSVDITNASGLTVSAGSTLDISGSNLIGLFSQGSLNNSGVINISNSGTSGLWLDGISFTNNGTINISNSGENGFVAPSHAIENVGDIMISNSGSLGFSMGVGAVTNSGNLFITGSIGNAFDITFFATFDNAGTLAGTGAFNVNGNTLNGMISPGLSPGTMTFPAGQVFSGTSTINIEVNGLTPNTEHDQIVVNGMATIGGSLSPTINYAPTNGDRIVLLSATSVSGTFSNISPALPSGWMVDYSVAGEVALVYSGVSLPVEFVDFSGKLRDASVELEWQTASEFNNSHFEVEWSGDGERFEKIGEVLGAGNSDELSSYYFLHRSPGAGLNYYRIKQVDFDGNYTYSTIIYVNIAQAETLKINVFPNPMSQYFRIEGIKEGDVIQIFNLNGQLVKEHKVWSNAEEISVLDLPSGPYFLRVNQVSERIVIQR